LRFKADARSFVKVFEQRTSFRAAPADAREQAADWLLATDHRNQRSLVLNISGGFVLERTHAQVPFGRILRTSNSVASNAVATAWLPACRAAQ
jgi:hypothetical protein